MDITDTTPAKRHLAMERFLQGEDSLEFNGVSFRILSEGEVEVAAISRWQSHNATEQTIRQDLLRGKQMVEHLVTMSPEFQRAIAERRLHYCVIDHYGNESVTICHENGDKLVWAPGLQPRTDESEFA